MDQTDLLSFYKWLTNIGLALFIAFSYLFLGPVTDLQVDLGNKNERIEAENAAIETINNNTTKAQAIKTNIARAENASRVGMTLSTVRIGSLLFLVIGLATMVYGLISIRKIVSPSDDEEI